MHITQIAAPQLIRYYREFIRAESLPAGSQGRHDGRRSSQ